MASHPQEACPSLPHPTTTQTNTLVPDILLATNLLAYLLADGGNQPSPSSDLSTTSLFNPPARYASVNRLAHESSVVRRPITSTTYARRMFVTEPLAILFGFHWPSVQACRLAETKLPAFVVDDSGRKWDALFEPRSERTITGQLGGGWSAFASAHRLRVGDVVEFWRQLGEWAGEYGVRARVIKGGWPEVHEFGAA